MKYVRKIKRFMNGGDNPDKATKKYTWMGVFTSPCVLVIPVILFV